MLNTIEHIPKTALYPRYIKSLLLEALKDSPAVLIHGPRQCGKTTLTRIVGEPKKYKYILKAGLKQEKLKPPLIS